MVLAPCRVVLPHELSGVLGPSLYRPGPSLCTRQPPGPGAPQPRAGRNTGFPGRGSRSRRAVSEAQPGACAPGACCRPSGPPPTSRACPGGSLGLEPVSAPDLRPHGRGTDTSDLPPWAGRPRGGGGPLCPRPTPPCCSAGAPLASVRAHVFQLPDAPSSGKTSLSATHCRPGSSPGSHTSPSPPSRVFGRGASWALTPPPCSRQLQDPHPGREGQAHRSAGQIHQRRGRRPGRGDARALHLPQRAHRGRHGGPAGGHPGAARAPGAPSAASPQTPGPLARPPLTRPCALPPQVYMELEQGKNADFWRDMTTITEDEIAKLRKLEASGKGPGNPGLAPG